MRRRLPIPTARGLQLGAAIGLIGVLGTSVPSAAESRSYTPAAVQRHASAKDCWTIVGSGVYDLTRWIPRHPGGSAVIKAMCGINATAAFASQHGLIGRQATRLAKFRIGTVAASPRPTAAPSTSPSAPATTATPSASPSASADPVYSGTQVSAHDTSLSCWSVVGTSVYDLTKWIPLHPGGSSIIKSLCGVNASAAFTTRHGSSAKALSVLKGYRIGAFGKTGTALANANIGGNDEDQDERDGDDD